METKACSLFVAPGVFRGVVVLCELDKVVINIETVDDATGGRRVAGIMFFCDPPNGEIIEQFRQMERAIPEPPPRIGELVPDPREPLKGLQRSIALALFTLPFNVTGQPAISLPLHWTPEGLPVGVQLVAAFGREDLLIRIASQIEQAQP